MWRPAASSAASGSRGAIALGVLLPHCYRGSIACADLTLASLRSAVADELVKKALLHSVFITIVATTLLIAPAFFVALAKARRRDAISLLTAIIAGVPIAVPGCCSASD